MREDFERIISVVSDVNEITQRLLGRPAFDRVSVPLPDLGSQAVAELRFLRTVTYCYALLIEAGRTIPAYIADVAAGYGVPLKSQYQETKEVVTNLRTTQHHNLSESARSAQIQDFTDAWFQSTCGAAPPKSPDRWNDCTQALMKACRTVVEGLHAACIRIEQDPDGSIAISDIQSRLSRDVAPHEFDRAIEVACDRFGIGSLDVVAFRNKHFAKWRMSLGVKEHIADLQLELTRLVEASLLVEPVALPITGFDLEQLGVPRGPKMKKTLEAAKNIYLGDPCSKLVLLERISNWLRTESNER
ncbi:hypothetical protein [Myxococcus fulvus]|uniref:hypothetical protein n=1 Tax=Myxococcus fulvus TaxID=33 RepID=UPI0020BF7F67|nr:hypothetical protein [Myxococcus fulvus]MCK8503578.1 hypothetical protein [Myxococcus fulvus]